MNEVNHPERTTALIWLEHVESIGLFSFPGDHRSMNGLEVAHPVQECAWQSMFRALDLPISSDGIVTDVCGGQFLVGDLTAADFAKWISAPEFQGAPVIRINLLRASRQLMPIGRDFAAFLEQLFALSEPVLRQVEGCGGSREESLPSPQEAC
jgi:hypothetical protein